MKKVFALLLAVVMCFSLVACGSSTTTTTTDNEKGKSTDCITIDGICVDNSYQEEGTPLKLVYLFYTLTATNENLEIDSVNADLTIDDANSYAAERYAKYKATAIKYMPNYYYTGYIQKVYTGTFAKVAVTFLIPEADLAEGKSITISDKQLPDAEELSLSTDDIEYFDNGEEIAKKFDAAGYEEAIKKYEAADEATTNKVKSLINGYEWSFYVNQTSYVIKFSADHNFNLRTSLGTSSDGTYSVLNGYIVCTYPGMEDKPIEIPYTLTDTDIDLNVTDAFDVRG